LHCALKTGYTVTLLSISNLAGYKSVTTRLHGYILVHQQLNRQHAHEMRPKAGMVNDEARKSLRWHRQSIYLFRFWKNSFKQNIELHENDFQFGLSRLSPGRRGAGAVAGRLDH